jgi:hypothetical protein
MHYGISKRLEPVTQRQNVTPQKTWILKQKLMFLLKQAVFFFQRLDSP